MSKPRNKTNRRRLHYFGVLAAAGLLTMGVAGTAMAKDYNTGDTIDNANLTDATGAVIKGNVDWDMDAIGGAGTTITNGLHFTENTAYTVTVIDSTADADTTATITSGGIEVTGAGAGTLDLDIFNLVVTAGDINGGTAGLNFTTSATSTITATSSDMYGEIDLGGVAASVKSVGVGGDATITVGAGNLTVGTTGFGDASAPTTSVINLTGAGALNASTANLAAGNILTVNFNAAAGASAIGELEAGSTLNIGGTSGTGQTLAVDSIIGGAGTVYTTVNLENKNHSITFATSDDITGNVAINFNDATNTTAQALTLGDIGSALADANLIVDGANTKGGTVTANDIYGVTTSDGTTITVEDGFAFMQAAGTNTIQGIVTVVDNTTTADTVADVVLGDLQANADLTYTGVAGGDGATLANVAGNATITNTTAGTKLAVAATAGGVTTTFKGAGETSVVFGAGDSAIIEGGNVVADALSNPLVNLDLDSTLGDAIYTNGTGADQTFTGQITAEIGNNNVIINADPATVPDNIGIAAAPGTILDINTTGTGNFKVANGYVAANYVAVGGTNPTTIDSDFTIGAAAPGDSGVFADVTAGDGALSVGAAMTVTGDFTVQTGYKGNNTTSGEAAIVIDAVGVGNGNTAITIDGAVDITAGTFFDVENQTVNGNIKIIDGTGVTKADMDNLAYVGGASNAWVTDVHNSSNVVYYDTDTGYFGTYDASAMSKAYSGQPRYATRYLNALDKHSGVPIAMGMRLSDNQEITMAMGNTLNAAMMMINNPLSGIFQNNNNLHAQTESRLAKSAGDCENFGLWITPNASFRSIDGDYGRGYGDVDIKSYGVTVGFDGWINDQFRLGLFAGVNSTDLDGDFQDIDGDDFQLGVYGQAFLPQGFTLNLGLAYSWQNYDANRRVYNTQDAGFNQRIKSDFDGNTLIAAIELSKTFSLDYDMFLRPAIGYTYMGTELDSYREKSTLLSNSPYNLAQRVGETDFDQHLFRVGTDIGWATDNAAVIGRVYYVGNAGDDQPETNARFRYANANVPSFKIYGAEYDDSMANLGLTVKVAPSENSHFAIDYDALLGSNSTTHNVNLTFKYEW